MTFVINDKSKSEYIKGLINVNQNLIPKDEVLDSIFNTIRDKQSAKKNTPSVEGETIERISDCFRYDRSIKTKEIRMMVLNTIINGNLIRDGVPIYFTEIIKNYDFVRKKDVIEDCQLQLSTLLFDKENSDQFWKIFELIYDTILNNKEKTVLEIYNLIADNPVLRNPRLEILTIQYLISVMKEVIDCENQKIAFGDNSLSFIEDRLSDGFNIIYSDDNNKGKTIVMQSALYALGNEPIFPASFNYQDYYHYVEVELENGEILSCCRKKNSFVVLLMDSISLFDSTSDLKRFFNKNGIVFPTIIKNNVKRMVDPVLLYQLFFVGQDGKDTSKIFNEGFYKKDDFRNLVFSFMGFKPIINSDLNEIELKNKMVELKEQKKVLLDKNEILKKNTPALNVLFQNSDARNFEEKIKKANNINDQIAELSKQRNRAFTRKAKNEKTLKELKSLNRTEKSGSLVCLDCNSKNIGYISGDRSYTFDISNEIMRNNILVSIFDRIEAYQEEISDCSSKINELQIQLQNVIKDDDVSLENYCFIKMKQNHYLI